MSEDGLSAGSQKSVLYDYKGTGTIRDSGNSSSTSSSEGDDEDDIYVCCRHSKNTHRFGRWNDYKIAETNYNKSLQRPPLHRIPVARNQSPAVQDKPLDREQSKEVVKVWKDARKHVQKKVDRDWKAGEGKGDRGKTKQRENRRDFTKNADQSCYEKVQPQKTRSMSCGSISTTSTSSNGRRSTSSNGRRSTINKNDAQLPSSDAERENPLLHPRASSTAFQKPRSFFSPFSSCCDGTSPDATFPQSVEKQPEQMSPLITNFDSKSVNSSIKSKNSKSITQQQQQEEAQQQRQKTDRKDQKTQQQHQETSSNAGKQPEHMHLPMAFPASSFDTKNDITSRGEAADSARNTQNRASEFAHPSSQLPQVPALQPELLPYHNHISTTMPHYASSPVSRSPHRHYSAPPAQETPYSSQHFGYPSNTPQIPSTPTHLFQPVSLNLPSTPRFNQPSLPQCPPSQPVQLQQHIPRQQLYPIQQSIPAQQPFQPQQLFPAQQTVPPQSQQLYPPPTIQQASHFQQTCPLQQTSPLQRTPLPQQISPHQLVPPFQQAPPLQQTSPLQQAPPPIQQVPPIQQTSSLQQRFPLQQIPPLQQTPSNQQTFQSQQLCLPQQPTSTQQAFQPQQFYPSLQTALPPQFYPPQSAQSQQSFQPQQLFQSQHPYQYVQFTSPSLVYSPQQPNSPQQQIPSQQLNLPPLCTIPHRNVPPQYLFSPQQLRPIQNYSRDTIPFDTGEGKRRFSRNRSPTKHPNGSRIVQVLSNPVPRQMMLRSSSCCYC